MTGELIIGSQLMGWSDHPQPRLALQCSRLVRGNNSSDYPDNQYARV